MNKSQEPLPSNLEEVLTSLIAEQFFDEATPINPHSDLFQLGFDSLAIMQLVILLETKWGVVIEARELTKSNFTTSADLTALIQRIAAEK